MCLSLKDRVAIVTGSGRGIGRAIALKLAEEGAKVAVNGVTPAMVKETVDLIEAEGNTAIGVLADVSKWEDVERLTKTAVETFGKLDILVHNAGVNLDAMFEKMSEEQWDGDIDVHLKGGWMCAKAALSHMLANRYGRIIIIGSEGGWWGNMGMINYVSAKAGQMGMTMTLARELARWGRKEGADLTCNLITPGFNDTRMTQGVPPHLREMFLSQIVLGRVADTREDVGSVVAFLASEEASYITGAKLGAAGGTYLNIMT